MHLNAFTDYAFRVLIYTAARPGRRCRSEEIAQAYGVSRHHLVKVVNQLQHLGYLETRRGRAGGFTLSKAPEQINLGEVARRTEGTLAVVECFDRARSTCPLTPACGLKGVLREALRAFFEVLDGYTVADLVAEPRWMQRVIALTPPSRAPHRRPTIAH